MIDLNTVQRGPYSPIYTDLEIRAHNYKFTHNYDDPDAPKIYFTSDTHFGHTKEHIWKAMGFESPTDHAIGIIANINSIVRQQDILIHLGDFCLDTTYEEFTDTLSGINCDNVHHLWGNHNSQIKQLYRQGISAMMGEGSSDNMQIYPLRIGKLNFLGHYAEIKVDKQLIVLSHFPIYSWNKMKSHTWMLHGHEHCTDPNSSVTGVDGKIFDVGINATLHPYSFDAIKSIMANKNVRTNGHH
jgi:calcineurin-like phosphoesterase family protein